MFDYIKLSKENIPFASKINKRYDAESNIEKALNGDLPKELLSIDWSKYKSDNELIETAVNKKYEDLVKDNEIPVYDCIISTNGILPEINDEFEDFPESSVTLMWIKDVLSFFKKRFDNNELLSVMLHLKSEAVSHVHVLLQTQKDMDELQDEFALSNPFVPDEKSYDFYIEGYLGLNDFIPTKRTSRDKEEFVYDLRTKKEKDEQSSMSFRKQEDVLDGILDYFTTVEKHLVQDARTGHISIEEFMDTVKWYLSTGKIGELSDQETEIMLNRVEHAIFGYYVLEDLIFDEYVSDIRVTAPNHIRIKRKGRRLTSNLTFRDEADYIRFLQGIALRNGTNLSSYNAVQNFTDTTGNDQYILRFDISTPYVNSDPYPYLIIRKIPKKKYTMSDLLKFDMMNQKTAMYLIDKVKTASGILFTGKGGSGKTTLMNTLLEYIPYDKSCLVIQENEELHSQKHPDIMFQRTVTSRSVHGEQSASFDLKALARNGLLADLDYFVIGEIKGGEALYAMNAIYTGHQCWASCHGASSTKAINKLADYVKYESDYSKEDCLKMLEELDVVVFMKNFKIYEISEVVGWDDQKHDLEYKTIFKRIDN